MVLRSKWGPERRGRRNTFLCFIAIVALLFASLATAADLRLIDAVRTGNKAAVQTTRRASIC